MLNKLFILLFVFLNLFIIINCDNSIDSNNTNLYKKDPSRLDNIACIICTDAANYIHENPMLSYVCLDILI